MFGRTMAILRSTLPVIAKKTSFQLALLELTFCCLVFYLLLQRDYLIAAENAIYLKLASESSVFRAELLVRPDPNYGIWYLAAMIGNLGTVCFVVINMVRRRRQESGDYSFDRGDIVFAVSFGALLLAVSIVAIPGLYFGLEAATFNLILTGIFSLFDMRGYKRAETLDELREYTVYFWFLDAPTFVASAFIVVTLHVQGVSGTDPFSIGIAAGMLVLLAVVSALSSLYVSIANSGLGAIVHRRFNPGAGANAL